MGRELVAEGEKEKLNTEIKEEVQYHMRKTYPLGILSPSWWKRM